jgi:hypothetical protein
MEELIGRILEKYGTPMEVLQQGKWLPLRAFLQPSHTKNRQDMRREVTPIGCIPGGQYVFIGPVGKVAEGDTLRMSGSYYVVQRLDTLHYGADAVYSWGLCSRGGEADTWGM